MRYTQLFSCHFQDPVVGLGGGRASEEGAAIKSEAPEKAPKKKTVSIAEDADRGGDAAAATARGASPGKPAGSRRTRKKNYNEVIYADKEAEKMEEQCRQQ